MATQNMQNAKSQRSEAGHRGLLRIAIGVMVLGLIILAFLFARSLAADPSDRPTGSSAGSQR